MLTTIITKITKVSPDGFTYPTWSELKMIVETNNMDGTVPDSRYDKKVFSDYFIAVDSTREAFKSPNFVSREFFCVNDQTVCYTSIYMSSLQSAVDGLTKSYTRSFVDARTKFGDLIGSSFETRLTENVTGLNPGDLIAAFESGNIVQPV